MRYFDRSRSSHAFIVAGEKNSVKVPKQCTDYVYTYFLNAELNHVEAPNCHSCEMYVCEACLRHWFLEDVKLDLEQSQLIEQQRIGPEGSGNRVAENVPAHSDDSAVAELTIEQRGLIDSLQPFTL